MNVHPLIGLLRRGIGPSRGLYLHRTAQHRKRLTYIYKPREGFEPTVVVLDLSKTVSSLDLAATGTSCLHFSLRYNLLFHIFLELKIYIVYVCMNRVYLHYTSHFHN